MTRGLYAIIDPDRCAGRDPLAVAEAVLNGGCAMLQLRAKFLPDRSYLELARRIQAICTSKRVPFVVNDRVHIAAIIGADGVHLGQDDLTVFDARRIVGEMQIGVSTHTYEQALQAERDGANLIGFGPVFQTRTKQNPDPVVGIAELARVASAVNIPVVAIGGIDLARAGQVRETGVHMVAVVSALCEATDPGTTAGKFHELISR